MRRATRIRASAIVLGAMLASCHATPSGPARTDAGDAGGPDGGDEDVAGTEAGAVLGPCAPGGQDACPAGSMCVQGCPSSGAAGAKPPGGLCSAPGRESCGCGIIPSPCTTPGLDCLLPACCDNQGLCVTPQEKATICAGPDAFRFACAP